MAGERINVTFRVSDYASYGVVATPISLTPRQCALIMSALSLMYYRHLWSSMSDVAWDDLSNDLADIADELYIP